MDHDTPHAAHAAHGNHESRIRVLEFQYKRIEADIESEKRTRADANAHINRKIDMIGEHMSRQDKILYAGMGVLAVLQFIAPFVIKR